MWVRNGLTTLEVPTSPASARYVDTKIPGNKLEVTATWIAKGTKGYEPLLDVYNTSTASGNVGQRVAIATSSSTVAELKGSLSAETASAPRLEEPRAASQAQPSAEVGGTMKDTTTVSAIPNTTVEMWPNAKADFTAYLQPEAGAMKVDSNWDPVLGDAYETQAEDPATGELLWSTFWAKEDGADLLDAAGQRIPTTDAAGAPTSGIAADGTDYPVQERDRVGVPIFDENGDPVYLTEREPVMDSRQDPVTWTEAELTAMTAAQQCVAQPVYKEGGIPVPGLGSYDSKPVLVKSAGTIHWVDRITSNGATMHQSKCGIASETTKIDQPAVITQALPSAMLGDELYDIATVSGKLSAAAGYQLRFEAFTAPEETPLVAASGTNAEEPGSTEPPYRYVTRQTESSGPTWCPSPGWAPTSPQASPLAWSTVRRFGGWNRCT